MSVEPSEMERYQPLYALPERSVTAPGGDVVTWGRHRSHTEIRLECAVRPSGSKLLAIQELQAASVVGTGRRRPDVATWHRYFIFRIQDQQLPQLHRAVLGIATGEHRAAAAYCRQVERMLEDALQELRALDAARESSPAAA